MDLKELRYFRAIVEFGTISKAAAHLRVAQPALSRQMHKLEHDLGTELLRRSSRGVEPTPAGEALLRRTIFIENEMEDTRREVSAFAKSEAGSLKIAVTWPMSISMAPAIAEDFSRRYPNVHLHILDGYSGNIADSLLERQLDAAVSIPPSHGHADISCIPLWTTELRLVCPAGAATGEAATLDEIEALPMIAPSAGSGLRHVIDRAFARHHKRFQPAIEADGPQLNFALVERGLGFTLFPHDSFVEMESAGRLTSRPVTPAIRLTIAVLTRASLVEDRPVDHFIALAKEIAVDVVRASPFSSTSLYPEIAEMRGD